MKKSIFVILIALILFSNIMILSAQEQRMIIKEKNESENTLSILSTKSSKSQTNELKIPKNKIIHDFGNYKSAKLTEKEIFELEKSGNYEIYEEPIKQLFMQDAIYLTNSTNVWAEKISETNLTGKGQTICVLDTGTNFSHPDLQEKNLTCVIDCTGFDCNENCSISDNDGHGTHVSGIISANGSLKGIAPDAKLISVKVCVSEGCYDTDIISGIEWCIENKEQYNISAISMSLGSEETFSNYCDADPQEILFAEAINNATSNNISVVVATGNEADYSGISSPACIEKTIRVGDLYKQSYGSVSWGSPLICTDATTSLSQFVCHANRANLFPDILFTYGALINSTCIPGDDYYKNGYCIKGGTSMSTPMVTGMIAILKQYKILEENKTLTDSETKEILINSSEKILDSETSTNFSKLNLIDIIQYADETAPTINKILPTISIFETGNITFSCNATDSLQLKNLTINVWNSTGLYYDFTNSSPKNNFLKIEVNVTLDSDTYTWNCESYDNKSNIAKTSNSTLTNSILTTLISPENETYTNQNQSFICNSYSPDNLTNATIYIWNSTDLIFNETQNISGNSNSTTFDYNFTEENIYFWNCQSFDNESNSTFAQENFSITYDITSPKINLVSPADNTKTTSKSITFTYSENEINPDYCNLTINGQNYSSFTQTLSEGTYYWNVTCRDKSWNDNSSETRTLTIYTAQSDNNPGGGSSGGSSSKTYSLTNEQIQNGISKKLKTNDKIIFKLLNESHTLAANSITEDSIKITISSTPITETLSINQTRKFDLNNDKIYDFEIKIESISRGYATINVQKINEEIPLKIPFNDSIKNNQSGPENIETMNTGFFKKIMEFFRKLFSKIFGG